MLSVVLNRASLLPTVYADGEKKLVKPSELDIYYEPPHQELTQVDPESQSIIYRNVSAVRQSISGTFPSFLKTHEKLSCIYSYIDEKISGLYRDTITDPFFLLTPGAIVLAAGAGAVMAGKGKRPFKRTLMAIGYGSTAAAVTHPSRALEIATTGYYHTASLPSVINLWWNRDDETITEKVINGESNRSSEEKANGETSEFSSGGEVINDGVVEAETEIFLQEEKIDEPASEIVVPPLEGDSLTTENTVVDSNNADPAIEHSSEVSLPDMSENPLMENISVDSESVNASGIPQEGLGMMESPVNEDVLSEEEVTQALPVVGEGEKKPVVEEGIIDDVEKPVVDEFIDEKLVEPPVNIPPQQETPAPEEISEPAQVEAEVEVTSESTMKTVDVELEVASVENNESSAESMSLAASAVEPETAVASETVEESISETENAENEVKNLETNESSTESVAPKVSSGEPETVLVSETVKENVAEIVNAESEVMNVDSLELSAESVSSEPSLVESASIVSFEQSEATLADTKTSLESETVVKETAVDRTENAVSLEALAEPVVSDMVDPDSSIPDSEAVPNETVEELSRREGVLESSSQTDDCITSENADKELIESVDIVSPLEEKDIGVDGEQNLEKPLGITASLEPEVVATGVEFSEEAEEAVEPEVVAIGGELSEEAVEPEVVASGGELPGEAVEPEVVASGSELSGEAVEVEVNEESSTVTTEARTKDDIDNAEGLTDKLEETIKIDKVDIISDENKEKAGEIKNSGENILEDEKVEVEVVNIKDSLNDTSVENIEPVKSSDQESNSICSIM